MDISRKRDNFESYIKALFHMETKKNYYSMKTIKVQEYLWNALMQYIRWNRHALYSIYGIAWVQLLSIKTNRAEHNRFSWFMFAHNNKASWEAQHEWPSDTGMQSHPRSLRTHTSMHTLPSQSSLSPATLMTWSLALTCFTVVLYLCAAETPATWWSVVVMGETRILLVHHFDGCGVVMATQWLKCQQYLQHSQHI